MSKGLEETLMKELQNNEELLKELEDYSRVCNDVLPEALYENWARLADYYINIKDLMIENEKINDFCKRFNKYSMNNTVEIIDGLKKGPRRTKYLDYKEVRQKHAPPTRENSVLFPTEEQYYQIKKEMENSSRREKEEPVKSIVMPTKTEDYKEWKKKRDQEN